LGRPWEWKPEASPEGIATEYDFERSLRASETRDQDGPEHDERQSRVEGPAPPRHAPLRFRRGRHRGLDVLPELLQRLGTSCAAALCW
jgi:hypothetical protein